MQCPDRMVFKTLAKNGVKIVSFSFISPKHLKAMFLMPKHYKQLIIFSFSWPSLQTASSD